MTDENAPAFTKAELEKLGRDWIEKIEAAEKREKDWIDAATYAEAAYLADPSYTVEALPDFNILHSNVETIVPATFNSAPKPDIRTRHKSRREDPAANAVAEMYERAIETQMDDGALVQEVEGAAQDTFLAGRGIVRVKFDADIDEFGSVTNERLIYECVSWRDYRQGPAMRWRDVPWTAYRHEVTEQERKRLEDEEITSKYEGVDEEKDCTIWEVWCKETRQVYMIVEQSAKVIAIRPDPLELPNFFPHGAPIQPITGTGKMTPVCPYEIYRKLAQELDRVTKRINAIMKGLKVRGGVLGSAEDIERLAEADDNELVPIQNVENLGAIPGGPQNAIIWWPVDTAITVLRELYVQREAVKESIYEITGISDIVRGASKSSETATAQQIKSEWGSLRVKKMQTLIERHVRDIIVLSAEIISRHFTARTLQEMTGVEIAPEAQEMALEMLRSPLDHYRIDIETDSTVRADLTKNRGEMSEFLRGTAEFFNTMAPVVQAAPKAAGPLAKMYSAFAMQFNLGKQAEDALDQFVMLAEQAAEGEQSDPEAEARQAELQLKAEEMQMKAEEMKGKMVLEVEKLQLQRDNLGMDIKLKQADLLLKEQQLNLEEAKAEIDAAKAFNEVGLEEEQDRPVKIG